MPNLEDVNTAEPTAGIGKSKTTGAKLKGFGDGNGIPMSWLGERGLNASARGGKSLYRDCVVDMVTQCTS